MINVGMVASNDKTLINGKNVVIDEYEISKTFNKRHIKIVENSSGND